MKSVLKITGALIALAALFSGCGHYHLGAPCGTLPFHNLYVAPITNKSYAPQAQAILTQQVIQALQQSGGVNIVAREEDADASLRIAISNFSRSVSATESYDVKVARAFSLCMSVNCTLLDLNTEKKIFENKAASATVNLRVNEMYQVAEYQGMPELTRKVALKVRGFVLDAWPAEKK